MNWRVGLIGCGWISSYQIAGWRLVPGVEVVAVCDRDEGRARALAAHDGIAWAGEDAVRMMEECRPDIVDIASTPASHKPLALAAIERGHHVLCQKPAAPTLAEAREMIESADRRHVALYINEMMRFCPWFLKCREAIQSGQLGRLAFARIFSRTPGFLAVGPERRVAYGFRDFLKEQQRMILLEETIHYLDVARFLFGEPRSIYCATERLSPLVRGEDIANIVLRYDGMTVLIEDSWSAAGPERSGMEIEGYRGSLFLSHSRMLQFYSLGSGKMETEWDYSDKTWPERRPEVFARLFEDFLAVIARKGDPTAQARDNLRTLELTLAAYDSASSGEVRTPTFASPEPRPR
jgi:predicted dehydrogenase